MKADEHDLDDSELIAENEKLLTKGDDSEVHCLVPPRLRADPEILSTLRIALWDAERWEESLRQAHESGDAKEIASCTDLINQFRALRKRLFGFEADD